MKKAIIIAALMCGTAHAEFRDGNKLYSQMTGTSTEEIAAISYIMGVSDAVQNVVHCAPPTVSAGQVYDMVKQHLQANPASRHFSGDTIVSYVLSRVWPCPKKGTGT